MNATKLVSFRITPTDFETLKKRAECLDQDISTYCRERVFEFREKEIAALELPNGEIIPVGQLQRGNLVFVGREYEKQEAEGA